MSTILDIAEKITQDHLTRTDILGLAVDKVHSFYKVLCDAIPFDKLRVTSSAQSFTAGVSSYSLAALPIAGIISVRAILSTTLSRRLKRTDTRVYDAISYSVNGDPMSYARYGDTIEVHPAPSSSSYTYVIRYWKVPEVKATVTITAASNAAAVVFTAVAHGLETGDYLTIRKGTGNWVGVNGRNQAVTKVSADTFSIAVDSTAYGVFTGQVLNASAIKAVSYDLEVPESWEELMEWEGLYRVLSTLGRSEEALSLRMPSQSGSQHHSSRKRRVVEIGIIPTLWNDLLGTITSREFIDEDIRMNVLSKSYTHR